MRWEDEHEYKEGKDFKRDGRGLFQDVIPELIWRDRGIFWNSSFIQLAIYPYTSLQRYRSNNLLGCGGLWEEEIGMVWSIIGH